MQGGDCSSGRSVLVHVAAEAVGTGHDDTDIYLYDVVVVELSVYLLLSFSI